MSVGAVASSAVSPQANVAEVAEPKGRDHDHDADDGGRAVGASKGSKANSAPLQSGFTLRL